MKKKVSEEYLLYLVGGVEYKIDTWSFEYNVVVLHVQKL